MDGVSKTLILNAYTRVSTLKQLEGGSLKFQKETIEQYCKIHNHTIKKIYTDKGVSAYKNRPQFEKMLEDVAADGIIVYDLTRFGRSTLDLLSRIHELDSRGKIFISIKETIDLSTKTGRLLLAVLSAIADFESANIRERMEAGREYAKEHGTKSGKPMHRPKIKIDWKEVDDWLARGMTLGQYAKLRHMSRSTLYKRHKERKK